MSTCFEGIETLAVLGVLSPYFRHGLGRLSPEEQEAFEERAAIVEYDGQLSRPMAECEATRMIGECRWWRDHGPAKDEMSVPFAWRAG